MGPHDERHLEPELDYGEGKTRRQDEVDAMYVIAYGCAATLVFLIAVAAIVVWLAVR